MQGAIKADGSYISGNGLSLSERGEPSMNLGTLPLEDGLPWNSAACGRLSRGRFRPARGSGGASAAKSRCHRFQHVVAPNEVMHEGRRRVQACERK